MSIDREFRFLSKSGNSNSGNSGNNIENSANGGNNKPSKMVDFIKDSTLKYLVPALLITAGGIGLKKDSIEEPILDESAASLILEDNHTNFKIDQLKLKTNNQLFNARTENLEDNFWGVMYDEGYNQNYISSISLDEDLNYAPGTHIFQTTKENLYWSMYKKLNMEDYQELFKGLRNLRQGSLGNCYFIVAIKNLARSKYFDTLMMTSVERDGDNSFNLYMPLGEPGGVKISITPDDLEATTIGGPLGYKILEIGFAKYLLFKKLIIPDTNIIMTDKLMKKMEVGSAGETMMSLLGPKSFVNKCIRNETSNRTKILNGLRHYDPRDLGTISVTSKFKEGETDKNSYEVGGEKVYYGHAYALCGIEKDGDTIKNVILENPWNNENKKGGCRIRLSIDDFFNSFSLINIGHKTSNFLNLGTFSDEVKVVDSRDRRKS